jgi:hypothetical protein
MFTYPYIHVNVPLQLSILVISKVSNGNYTTSTSVPIKYITPITNEYSYFQKVSHGTDFLTHLVGVTSLLQHKIISSVISNLKT